MRGFKIVVARGKFKLTRPDGKVVEGEAADSRKALIEGINQADLDEYGFCGSCETFQRKGVCACGGSVQ